ncbi:calpain-9-like isoform X2 [Ciona intestinalis]
MPYYYQKKTIRRAIPAAPGYGGGGGGVGKYGRYNSSSAPPKETGGPKRYQCATKQRNPQIDIQNKTVSEVKEELVKRKILYEDPEFPADWNALFYSPPHQRPRMDVEWKRPHDISDDPQLFVGGASRFDIMQGELGDCWLLAAIASLSLNDDLLYRIIPPDQSFSQDYCGMFHFQFWQYGEWIDVMVDDLLPTVRGKLVYLHSAQNNEFWSALLEKAYAKLNGSYEALKGGSTTEAMEDFTGGVTEVIDLKEAPNNLYSVMHKSLKKGALMGCAVETTSKSQREAKLSNGLLMGHAYSITGLDILRNGVKLVRVRNPWGQVEWNGAWSDGSSSWNRVPDEKQRLDVEFGEDGEFWMSYEDFCRCYTKLEICNLGPDAVEDDDVSTQWITSLHEGRWTRGCTAGGCRNFPDTFWVNPQFRLILEEEDDDPEDDVVGCSFILSLMQKNRRKQKVKGQGLLTIGFALYKLKESVAPNQTLKKDFFLYNQSVARSKNFINLRENSQRFKLPPGEYCIVPSTFQPNEEADFVLRIYTEKRAETGEIDEETKQTVPVAPEPAPTDDENDNDKKFKKLFDQLTGEDGEIDAFELRDIINSVMKKNASAGKFEGFGLEACRSMVALMDVTNSGKLDYDEFKALWVRVRKWINIFKQFDKDGSGNFDSYELRDALSHAGYSLSSRLYQMLCVRYASKDLTIDMDDFVLLSVRLETMFNSFNEFKGSGREAKISLEAWLVTTMYS